MATKEKTSRLVSTISDKVEEKNRYGGQKIEVWCKILSLQVIEKNRNGKK